jgi:hypothetical protein
MADSGATDANPGWGIWSDWPEPTTRQESKSHVSFRPGRVRDFSKFFNLFKASRDLGPIPSQKEVAEKNEY